MNKYSVIMAGGGGTRFWPLSRRENPKQFLNLTGREMMVNETVDRVTGNVPKEDIFIVTNASQAPRMKEVTTGRILEDHILAEPAARNTSACIGYAAMEIVKKYGDGVMCVLPSDHYIKQEKAYWEVMDFAIGLAEQTNRLITIGIKPTFASTAYGYIKYNKKSKEIAHSIGGYSGKRITAYTVDDFVEKPGSGTARAYLENGGYLWNSGMFVWKASVILSYFEELLPEAYECLSRIGEAMGSPREQEVLQEIYPKIPKISIDYGIMERSDDIIMIAGDFGWNDVGSWDSLEALYETDENGNVEYGEQLHIGSENCIFYAQDKMIATIGLDNIIVVETKDAVLVCDKSKAQDVKRLVEMMEEQGKEKYL